MQPGNGRRDQLAETRSVVSRGAGYDLIGSCQHVAIRPHVGAQPAAVSSLSMMISDSVYSQHYCSSNITSLPSFTHLSSHHGGLTTPIQEG